MHLWQIQGVRDVLIVLVVLCVLWVGQKTSVVTVPLLLAVLFAYLFEPVIVWIMQRFKFQRRSAVVSVMAMVVAVVLVPAVVGISYGVVQLASFANTSLNSAAAVREALAVPIAADASAESATSDTADADSTPPQREAEDDREASDNATQPDPATEPDQAKTPAETKTLDETKSKERLARLRNDPPEVRKVWNEYAGTHKEQIGITWLWIYDQIRRSQREDTAVGRGLDAAIAWIDANSEQIAKTAASFGAETVTAILRFVGAAFGLIFTLFVTAFFFFFVSTEWIKLKGFGHKLLPDRNREFILHLLHRFDAVISGFIRGRLTIAFLQAIVFTIGYLIIGVPAAFILGPLVAILSIVPYLALVGVPISVLLLALSVEKGDESFRAAWWWIIGAPTAFYFIGQTLDDYVWTPLIQGKSTGMDTPTILFASLAGGALFGVFGLLIAIPIAACIKILIQEVLWPRFKDWAEGREQDFLPIDRT